MKKLLQLTLVISLFGSACQNAAEYKDLKGKIVDVQTNQPVANRKVIVHDLLRIGDTEKEQYQGEFYTNETGNFTYKLRKSKITYFYAFNVVGDSVYAFSNNLLGLTDLNRDGKFLEFKVRKLAQLDIKIERKSLTTYRDTLFVSWKSDNMDGEVLYPYKIENYGIVSDMPLRWIGGDVKSTILTRVYADKKTVVRWVLFRNGRRSEIYDTVFCKRTEPNNLYFRY